MTHIFRIEDSAKLMKNKIMIEASMENLEEALSMAGFDDNVNVVSTNTTIHQLQDISAITDVVIDSNDISKNDIRVSKSSTLRNVESRQLRSKPKAIAFVDYEYWYYSSQDVLNSPPDIDSWHAEVSAKYQLMDIIAFGAFRQCDIAGETKRIRRMTNHIVMTDGETNNHRKDVTDFVMLDFIYRTAETYANEDMTYILFTGDGHFQSVVRYLTTKCASNVILYGIPNTMSIAMMATASEAIICKQNIDATNQMCYRYIIENFESIHVTPGRDVNATFTTTVEIVAQRNSISQGLIRSALQQLIDAGHIIREIRQFDNGQTATVLIVPDIKALSSLKYSGPEIW